MPQQNNNGVAMPVEQELVPQDRKDFERFTKFFTIKYAQVVVEARSGKKIQSPNRPNGSGADWFNIAIDDNPDVLKQTKLAFGTNSLPDPPILVEIILKTSDSTELTLEVWSCSFTEVGKEPNVRIHYTVYNRMTHLLKSLLTTSRSYPAYKISRMKGGDYSIEYKVFSGCAQDHYNNLGKELLVVHLGSVGTPYGTIHVELAYRTKMELSSYRSPVIYKEDHFDITDSTHHQPDSETANQVPQPRSPNYVRVPAFVDPKPELEREFDENDMPFANLMRMSPPLPKPVVERIEKMSPPPPHHEIDSSSGGEEPNHFEFIDIRPPAFAEDNPGSDPAALFASLKNAPPLMSLPRVEIREIDRQMEIFEEDLDVFDDFVQTLRLD